MTTTKRGCGRPEDASLYRAADHAKLAQIADLIAKAPELKPTTAMTRIGVTDESTVRRLRRRWTRYKIQHLADAQVRLRARTPQNLMEEITLGLVQVANLAVRERMGIPGDTVRLLAEYRALGSFDKLGAAFGMLKLATANPSISDRMRPYRDLGHRPEFRALKDALGPRPDFSAIKSVLGSRPDLGVLHQLYKPGGALDMMRSGRAIDEMFRTGNAIGDTFRRRP